MATTNDGPLRQVKSLQMDKNLELNMYEPNPITMKVRNRSRSGTQLGKTMKERRDGSSR